MTSLTDLEKQKIYEWLLADEWCVCRLLIYNYIHDKLYISSVSAIWYNKFINFYKFRSFLPVYDNLNIFNY